MNRLIFIFVISRFHFSVISFYLRHNRASISSCDVSIKTVQEGFHCPPNQFEWDQRAKEMNCDKFAQNCTEKNNFVYHCLINAWSNGTIEVCAPQEIIAGSYCAEFSKGGARVQAHYRSKCKSCPFRYNSSDIFKYQECYDLMKTPEISTKQGHTESTSSVILDTSNGGEQQNITKTTDKENIHGGTLQAGKIAGIVFVVLSLCVLLVSFVLLLIRRKQADQNMYTEENPLKINKDLVKYLCKREKEKPGSLKKRILQSPFWNEYADSKPSENKQIKVTGNFKEDLAIKAAADVFNIKIYVVIPAQDNEETIICFFPKDPDAEKWIKISLDKDGTCKLLSDWVTCNKEEAQLTYDNEIVWKVEEDGGEIISKQEFSEILITR